MQYKEEQKKGGGGNLSRIDHRIAHTDRSCLCVCLRGERDWISSPHAAGEPIKLPRRDQRSEVNQLVFDRQVSAGGLGGIGGKRFETPQSWRACFSSHGRLSWIFQYFTWCDKRTDTDMYFNSKKTHQINKHTWTDQQWSITMDTDTQNSSFYHKSQNFHWEIPKIQSILAFLKQKKLQKEINKDKACVQCQVTTTPLLAHLHVRSEVPLWSVCKGHPIEPHLHQLGAGCVCNADVTKGCWCAFKNRPWFLYIKLICRLMLYRMWHSALGSGFQYKSTFYEREGGREGERERGSKSVRGQRHSFVTWVSLSSSLSFLCFLLHCRCGRGTPPQSNAHTHAHLNSNPAHKKGKVLEK